MANMFSGNQEKKIPKNFKECYETDNVTQNLWIWCERLEKWGKILFWVLIVGGLILSISTSIVEKEVVVREATYWGEAETELRKTFDFEIFIPLLLETALYAFLEYCAYHILALLVGSLATIVQHTKITANITLYNSAKTEGVIGDEETMTEQPQKHYEKSSVLSIVDPSKNDSHIKSNIVHNGVIPDYYKKEDIYSCPKCGCTLKKGQVECLCSTVIDWSNIEK